MDTDVVIAGGGIGGAVLALKLARRGRKVCVLEREATPPRQPRPEVLHALTLAELDKLGVGERIRNEASMALRGFEVRLGAERLFGFAEEDLAAVQAAPRSTDPALTRALLLEAAMALDGVQVLRGAEVREVIHEGARVAGVRGVRNGAPFEMHCRLVAGDDGTQSAIRKALGIPISLKMFPMDFVTAALDGLPEEQHQKVRAWLNPHASSGELFAAGLFPLPGGRAVTLIPMAEEAWEGTYGKSPDKFWQDLAQTMPWSEWLRERVSFPAQFARIRRPYGHAETYVAEGAALLGDAAHPMSPAGGQGANASIWDALALAEVAEECLASGAVTRERLGAYERRRRTANARSVSFTERAVTLLRFGPWIPGAGKLFAAFLRHQDGNVADKRNILLSASTAFMDA